MGASEDRLFGRWCRHADAGALGELFDLASPGLLRLAIHLVGDPAQAEDLVQATFLAAIEQRASLDGGRPVMPWLTAVLSNKAADAKRRAGRWDDLQQTPESIDEDASGPAERREISGELARAIDALEEPYRQVMLLRLRHGLCAADIAHLLERSPGTVRVQLHRARQKLRRLLPPALVAACFPGSASSRGLAIVRAELMAKAGSLSTAATASASAATFLGGLIMGQKVALAVAVVVLAAGAWWITSRGALSSQTTAAPPADAHIPLAQAQALSAVPRSAREDLRTVVVAELGADQEPFGALEIEVVWADGTPAPDVGLSWLAAAGAADPRPTRLVTDGSGHVHLGRVQAGTASFWLDRWARDPEFGRTFSTQVLAGTLNRLRIDVPPGQDVRGRVLDAQGEPVAGAQLWLSRLRQECPFPIGLSGQDGTFHVRSLHPREHSMFANAKRRGISKTVAVMDLAADEQGARLVELRLSGTCAELAGTVAGPDGEPITDADVRVTLETSTSVSGTILQERALADGSFRIPGLCRSKLVVQVASPGHPLWSGAIELEEGESGWIDVRLEAGVTVVGTVRTREGAPLAGAWVEWAENSMLTYTDLAWKSLRCRTDASGAFCLAGFPPGEIRVEVEGGHPGGGQAATTLHGAAGETVRWDVILASDDGEISGRVVDESGDPVAGWSVGAIAYGVDGAGLQVAKTDEEGRFALRDCADVNHVVRLYPPGPLGNPLAQRDFVRPGPVELEFRVLPSMRPTASLTGIVLDADGAPVQQLWIQSIDERGRSQGLPTCEPDGRFRIVSLPAGRYRLSCGSSLLVEESLGTFELGPGESLEIAPVKLARRGYLEVAMRRVDGVALSEPMSLLAAEEGGGQMLTAEHSDDGVLFRSRALPPGGYRLYPIFANGGAAMREVLIRPGETTSLELQLLPATRRMITFRVPAGVEPPATLTITVFDASDAVFSHSQSRRVNRDRNGFATHMLHASFPAGSYRFEASSAEGLGAAGTFQIEDPDAPYEGFGIELTPRH